MDTFQTPELKDRAAKFLKTDKAALQAIAQAAIDVELFTLPLYMVSMYSIQGMHQITSKGNDFYRGRLWPGASPARDPVSSPNAAAFNHFFSVFIDEMLHLQLASNIAKALGAMPSYTSKGLVDDNCGWVCYGPDKTVLPHILDFKDCVEGYNDIRVKLDALTLDQNRLFLAIEQNEKSAEDIIDPLKKVGKYFPKAPFAPEYVALLRTNDPGEEPLDGGLLAAQVGKGGWAYTSFGWYRQWRNGHEGAYRVLANLAAWGKSEKR